jgi:hypothetical protein
MELVLTPDVMDGGTSGLGGLLSSSAELAEVVDYQVLDYRNSVVLKSTHRSCSLYIR